MDKLTRFSRMSTVKVRCDGAGCVEKVGLGKFSEEVGTSCDGYWNVLGKVLRLR